MNKKSNLIFTIICMAILVGVSIFLTSKAKKNLEPPKEPEISYQTIAPIKMDLFKTYEDYLNKMDNYEVFTQGYNFSQEDFNYKKYLLLTLNVDSCSEEIVDDKFIVENDTLKVYFDIESTCGLCAPQEETKVISIPQEKEFTKTEVYYGIVSREECDPNVEYKPMIYIYPTEDTDLTLTLGNKHLLTSTYPKYKNSWNVHVDKKGNIYDYDTKRNYYGLYWEALDYTKLTFEDGFVVKGQDTIKFLEEKLEILGLNEKEINEFIVYWISKLENNKYNYIRFRTLKEANEYMPLNISKKPDTLIRVLVDFKALDEKINVKEQKLTKVNRKGFTVVEWGGTLHK